MSPRYAFDLDPGVYHLNHGSFGAVTIRVQEAQARLRRRMERDTMRFFTEEYLFELDAARRTLAQFVGAKAEELAFVRNSTEGVSSVLGSLHFAEGDEILINDHEYGACVKACRRTGARVVQVELPVPINDPAEVVASLLSGVTERTRLVLISHVTSPTGIRLPLEAILEGLEEMGVRALVDGAHAPGMIDLDLSSLAGRGLAYYVANLHKWVCAPKGSAFLWVREDLQNGIYPATTSHGYDAVWPGKSAFHTRFDWVGTDDPSPFLVVPNAIEALDSLHENGCQGVRKANRALALEARAILQDALGAEPLCPETMIGSLAAVKLPNDRGPARPHPLAMSDLQTKLNARGYRVPITDFPKAPARLIRISAHRYNSREEYLSLAEDLVELLAEEALGPP